MPDSEPSNRAARPACDSSLPASMAPGGLKHFRSGPVIYYPDACPQMMAACHDPTPKKDISAHSLGTPAWNSLKCTQVSN